MLQKKEIETLGCCCVWLETLVCSNELNVAHWVCKILKCFGIDIQNYCFELVETQTYTPNILTKSYCCLILIYFKEYFEHVFERPF